MDLNEILIFTRVVETGSFTAAAKKLEMPKSTVSRKVSALEARLGVRLLHRTTRQLHLTEVGASFHVRCAAVLLAIAQAERAVTQSQVSPTGRLRVTAPVDLGIRVLSPIIAAFLRRYPDVQVELDLSSMVVDLVAGGFDVALRAASQLPDSSLVARKLGVTQRLIVATPAYLSAHGAPTQPDQLASHAFVLHSSQTLRTTLALRGPSEVRRVTVGGNVCVNEFGMARELTLAGLGLATLPDVICTADLRSGALVRLLPEWHMADATIYAVYPTAQHISATLRAFLDFLKDEMDPAPWLV